MAIDTPTTQVKPVIKKIWRAADIGSRPHMEGVGIAVLEQHLKTSECYLEYGAGGSTVMAATIGVAEIHSVESHEAFLGAVERRVAKLNTNSLLFPHFVDIGPTKEWGKPTDTSCAKNWPSYCSQPWTTLMKRSKSPQLVLIDGRFRVACFLASLTFAKPGCVILFDDYVGRTRYYTVERHVAPRALIGRMAEFIVPDSLDRVAITMDLLKSCTDPA